MEPESGEEPLGGLREQHDLGHGGSPGPPQLAKNLNQILTRTVAADLVKPVDLELKDLDTDYLYELATQIYADLKRAAESLAKRPYPYQYKGPEQRAPNPAGKN